MAEEAGGGTVPETNEDGAMPEETGGGTAAEEAGNVAGVGPVVEDTLVRADICLFLR